MKNQMFKLRNIIYQTILYKANSINLLSNLYCCSQLLYSIEMVHKCTYICYNNCINANFLMQKFFGNDIKYKTDTIANEKQHNKT